jgi:hypothetical protein
MLQVDKNAQPPLSSLNRLIICENQNQADAHGMSRVGKRDTSLVAWSSVVSPVTSAKTINCFNENGQGRLQAQASWASSRVCDTLPPCHACLHPRPPAPTMSKRLNSAGSRSSLRFVAPITTALAGCCCPPLLAELRSRLPVSPLPRSRACEGRVAWAAVGDGEDGGAPAKPSISRSSTLSRRRDASCRSPRSRLPPKASSSSCRPGSLFRLIQYSAADTHIRYQNYHCIECLHTGHA